MSFRHKGAIELFGFLLVLWSIDASSKVWNIGETGIYSYPTATITENSIVMFAFLDGSEVWIFDKETREKKRLTKLGQAPHEIQTQNLYVTGYGTAIWVVVLGHNKVLEFNDRGDFIKSIAVPPDLAFIYPVEDGWYSLSGQMPGFLDQPTCLVFFDEAFSKRRNIKCWSSEETRGSSVKWNTRTRLFDPSISQSMLIPFFNNQYMTIHIANMDHFLVYETKSHSLVLDKTVDFPRKKFDQKWGEKELAMENKYLPAGFKLKAQFPEFFPKIKFVHGKEWGQIQVEQWNTASEKPQYVTYDLKGNEVKEHELAKSPYPVIKIEGEQLYFYFVNEDESWSVGWLSKEEFSVLAREKYLGIPQ